MRKCFWLMWFATIPFQLAGFVFEALWAAFQLGRDGAKAVARAAKDQS